jgi:hypothetical protein
MLGLALRPVPETIRSVVRVPTLPHGKVTGKPKLWAGHFLHLHRLSYTAFANAATEPQISD